MKIKPLIKIDKEYKSTRFTLVSFSSSVLFLALITAEDLSGDTVGSKLELIQNFLAQYANLFRLRHKIIFAKRFCFPTVQHFQCGAQQSILLKGGRLKFIHDKNKLKIS